MAGSLRSSERDPHKFAVDACQTNIARDKPESFKGMLEALMIRLSSNAAACEHAFGHRVRRCCDRPTAAPARIVLAIASVNVEGSGTAAGAMADPMIPLLSWGPSE